MTPPWNHPFCFGPRKIPLAWGQPLPLDWAHSGVFLSVFVSEMAVGLFTPWLFSRGHWKAAQVVLRPAREARRAGL